MRQSEENGTLSWDGVNLTPCRLTPTGRLANNGYLQYLRRFPENVDNSAHYELEANGDYHLRIAFHIESATHKEVATSLKSRMKGLLQNTSVELQAEGGGIRLANSIDCENMSDVEMVKQEIERMFKPFHELLEGAIADVLSGKMTTPQSSLKELQEFERAIGDGVLKQLITETGAFSPFNVLRASDHEIRHSNVLGWLMDPNGSHGLHDVCLREFLSNVKQAQNLAKNVNEKLQSAINSDEILDCNVSRETGRRGSKDDNESGQMDLVLTIATQKLIVVVENKWDAAEIGEWTPKDGGKRKQGQLARYIGMIDKCPVISEWTKVYVYLTPLGIKPERSDDQEKWISLGYQSVLSTLDKALKTVPNVNDDVKRFLEQYKQILVGKIGKHDKETQKICSSIYAKHKEALDFIKRNREYLLRHSRNVALGKLCDAGWLGNRQADSAVDGECESLDKAKELYCKYLEPINTIFINCADHGWNDDYPQLFLQFGRRCPEGKDNSIHYEVIDYGHGFNCLQVCLHVEGGTDKNVKKDAELLIVPFKKNWPIIPYIGRSADDILGDLNVAIDWMSETFEGALKRLDSK